MTAQDEKPKTTRKGSKRTTVAGQVVENKSRALKVFVKPGETVDAAMAGIVTRGLVTNASTAIWFLQAEHEDLSLMDMARELRTQGEAVNRGDFSVSERMLNAQAVALNAIFAEMARRAALNMGEHLPATEAYMRLALKAQGQCRATLETLSAMKNPPVVFARQANIANGPQQVNNGAAPENQPVRASAHAHAEKSTISPNELLEETKHGRQELDPRATQTTVGEDSQMEAVGAGNRPAKR